MNTKKIFLACLLALMILSGTFICVMAQTGKELEKAQSEEKSKLPQPEKRAVLPRPEKKAKTLQLVDGVYEASISMMDVSVTVEKGRIADIKILQHRGGEEYEEKIMPLVDAMIEKQSTDVDAVMGATASTRALKIAVEQALRKARLQLPEK